MDDALRDSAARQSLGLCGRRNWQTNCVPLAYQLGAVLLTDRRAFFQDTFGRLLHRVVERAEKRVAPKRWFRPPGAAPEVAFVAACTRCGDCIDVCPVHAILKTPASGGGFAAGTPYNVPAGGARIPCGNNALAPAVETGPRPASEHMNE